MHTLTQTHKEIPLPLCHLFTTFRGCFEWKQQIKEREKAAVHMVSRPLYKMINAVSTLRKFPLNGLCVLCCTVWTFCSNYWLYNHHWHQEGFASVTVFIDRQTVGTSACSPLPSNASMAACSMPSFCLLTPHSGAAEKRIYSAAGTVGGGVLCRTWQKLMERRR